MAGKNSNITVFRKRTNINIGIVLFGAIFIYLIAAVLMYLTGTHISAYEVREGSILKDNAYTGLILREEEVITAEADGYVNYFAPEGSKVGAKTDVYSLSSKELKFEDTSSKDSEALTVDEESSLQMKIQEFAGDFQSEQFGSVYTLKENISLILESKSSQNRQAQLNEMVKSGEEGLNVMKAAADGVIVYAVDGYEGKIEPDVDASLISKAEYNPTEFYDNMHVRAGDPVYKLVTSDTWTLAVILDDDTAKELADAKSVRVRFSKDQETAAAGLSIYQATEEDNEGKYYIAFLTFDSSMVRYAQERFLDIELILQDESGLKIPKSSVVEKDFYVVPEDYLTQGGNSKETGVLIESGKDHAEFHKTDVYYRDNDTGTVYLDPNVFDKHTVIIKPDSADTMKLEKTKSLKGVYNINKGYAVFKQIRILCESDEYYIVEAGNDYGLANYDHIALVGEDVKENDIVF